MKVLSGMAAWSDQTGLYPDDLPKREQLRYYSLRLPLVEVNSTFHAIQPPRNFAKWAEETPEEFVMNVKAYKALTGQGKDAKGRDEIALFRAMSGSVRPLREAGKFGCWVFQFPPWFRPGPRSESRLISIREELAGDLVAVEVRHASWFEAGRRSETIDLLRRLGFVNVIVDEPSAELTGLTPTVAEVTNPALAYFRLMGRDDLGRLEGEEARKRHLARENYRYTQADWEELSAVVDSVAGAARVAHVIWHNNGASANAVESAIWTARRFGSLPASRSEDQPSLFDPSR